MNPNGRDNHQMAYAEFRCLVAKYLDGDLPARQFAGFSSHLGTCQDRCRYLEIYCKAVVLLKEEPHILSETESSLLTGLRSGDPGSFEQVVRSHSARLLATASRILGSERDAQDAVQEALISAWKSIDGFEGTSSLYTWLHRIVVNACLARLRTARSKNEVSIAGADRPVSVAFERLPSAWSHPEPNLEQRLAMRRAIHKALNLIPDDLRIVLLLRDVEEMSSREVSERLGIADSAVRQRLHRARTAMAELLRPDLCVGSELTCGGEIDLLLDYIDSALPSELQLPVHAHIESCERCGNLMNTYRETIGVPRAIARLMSPNDISEGWISETVTRSGQAVADSSGSSGPSARLSGAEGRAPAVPCGTHMTICLPKTVLDHHARSSAEAYSSGQNP